MRVCFFTLSAMKFKKFKTNFDCIINYLFVDGKSQVRLTQIREDFMAEGAGVDAISHVHDSMLSQLDLSIEIFGAHRARVVLALTVRLHVATERRVVLEGAQADVTTH